MTENIESIVAGITENAPVQHRARQLLDWVAQHIEWTCNDYESRTVEEILERGKGQCGEIAKVFVALLKAAGIEYRVLRDICLHPQDREREASARQLVEENGPGFSVFGLQHNDHMWLELFDPTTKEWFPCDPTFGLAGFAEWISARLGFDDRSPELTDWIAPFCVAMVSGESPENSSDRYLIDAFDAQYGGRLSRLGAWEQWMEAIRSISPVAVDALGGKANLLDQAMEIQLAQEAYTALRKEYVANA